MDPLPYDIVEAMIQVFGRSFYYKDSMASFLLGAGVPKSLIDNYRTEYKYPWARKILNELSNSEEGRIIQRKILTQMCRLRNLPDPNVSDKDAGLDALRRLQKLANEYQMIYSEEKKTTISRRELKAQEVQLLNQRAQKLEELRNNFNQNVTNINRQSAGYSLENLLEELFALFEIEYRPPYKVDT